MAEDNKSGVIEVHPAGEDEIEHAEDEQSVKLDITVSDKTIKDSIDDYFDSKKVLIADKVGVAIESIDSNVGGAMMAYIMSGTMMRSGLALMCYEASGGDGNDADDIAAIIEALSTASSAREEIISHDYAGDINSGVKSAVDAPGAVLKGDFGIVGDIFGAIVGSPKALVDGVNLAKAAVNDTVAEVWRGDYTRDSAYITQIKSGSGIAMSTACRVGSEKAGYEECVELCHLYGRNFAVAYAVAEDMCKMISCVESNALEFDMGLAIAYSLDQCGANALIGDIDNKALFKELKRGDNIEDAKLRMMITYNKYAKAAISAANRLPDSIYKEMLIAIPNYMFTGLKEEYEITEGF